MSCTDIILILLLCAWCVVAVVIMVKRHKKGKHFTCGGDCGSCPMKNREDCDIQTPKDSSD
ncbi:MAG: FeoB-associated Cys-rich membrane protein [Clostridiales bacterium]|nr:FeoB-associated Cys-rich membrane protein [Clostridiales bacterium]